MLLAGVFAPGYINETRMKRRERRDGEPRRDVRAELRISESWDPLQPASLPVLCNSKWRWSCAAWLVLAVMLEAVLFILPAFLCQHGLRLRGSSGLGNSGQQVHMLLMADTHVLGARRRNWLDILWSDWGLRKALTAALFVHGPDVVVVNGDVLDEGDIADPAQFQQAVHRFRRIFAAAGHGFSRARDCPVQQASAHSQCEAGGILGMLAASTDETDLCGVEGLCGPVPSSAGPEGFRGRASCGRVFNAGPLLLTSPGNHDVGLGNPWSARLLLDRFEKNVGVASVLECVSNTSLLFVNVQVRRPWQSCCVGWLLLRWFVRYVIDVTAPHRTCIPLPTRKCDRRKRRC